MKNQTIVKYSLLCGLFLALLSGISYFFAERNIVLAAYVFFSALFSCLPLPYLLASPIARIRSLRRAQEAGITILNAAVLSHFAEASTLVLAKNGVITAGHPYISELVPEGTNQASLLALAASAERKAEHPVGRALLATAMQRRCRLQNASAFSEVKGRGAEALIASTPVRVGHADWLIEEGVAVSKSLLARAGKIADAGMTPLFVSYGKHTRGIIAIRDDIPDEVAPSLHRLQRRGLSVHMMTGDPLRTASAIKKQLALNGASAALSPSEKAREVQLLRTHGHIIAMIGAGARDAAALGEADVRIQLVRKGSDAESQHAAEHTAYDVRLESGHMKSLLSFLAISRKFASLTRENRTLAVLTWILLVPAATGVFHPFGAPLVPPLITLLGVLLASLLIVLNSLRA